MRDSKFKFERRRARTRYILRQKVTPERPRLSIHRSSKHFYAQVIDDVAGRTLAAASSLDKELGADSKLGANKAAASAVGQLLAKRALKAGVKQVVFDRGGFLYHGRVQAFADAAREQGLEF